MNVDRIINEVFINVKKSLLEGLGDDHQDITNMVLRYIKLAQMGEMGDSAMSIEACKLHDTLMDKLWLNHENENDRKEFLKFLNGVKNCLRYTDDIEILVERNGDVMFTTGNNSKDSCTGYNSFRAYDDDYTEFNLFGFESYDGIYHDEVENREGSINGSSGYYVKHGHMSDDMKKKIYDMGLIPAIAVSGSYHENFPKSVGIYPNMLNKVDDWYEDIYLDCKF